MALATSIAVENAAAGSAPRFSDRISLQGASHARGSTLKSAPLRTDCPNQLMSFVDPSSSATRA
eukprot:6851191-Pyramimonas_sp.AAC.1